MQTEQSNNRKLKNDDKIGGKRYCNQRGNGKNDNIERCVLFQHCNYLFLIVESR